MCVGGAGPSPAEVAAGFGGSGKSTVGGRERVTPSNGNIRIGGDDSASSLKTLYDKNTAKGRAQQRSEGPYWGGA